MQVFIGEKMGALLWHEAFIIGGNWKNWRKCLKKSMIFSFSIAILSFYSDNFKWISIRVEKFKENSLNCIFSTKN